MFFFFERKGPNVKYHFFFFFERKGPNVKYHVHVVLIQNIHELFFHINMLPFVTLIKREKLYIFLSKALSIFKYCSQSIFIYLSYKIRKITLNSS